ncbi:MAG: SH3 domain-containing protein [Flavobacteriales bacterium]|jgi:hypothetical protein
MRKIVIIIIGWFFVQTSILGQSSSAYRKAVISDPDGYTNVRQGKSVEYSIVARIYENEVFYVIPSSSSNWYSVLTKAGVQGYVHNSRIRFVNSVNTNQGLSREELALISSLIGASSTSGKLICKRKSCQKEFCCGWEHSSVGGCKEACITGIKCRGDYCSEYCCEKY